MERRAYLLKLPAQLVAALLLVAGILYGGFYHAPDGLLPVPSSEELSVKMLYTFRCFLFPVLFLGVVIGLTGLKRVKVGAANPLSGNEAAMLVNKKRLTNTLEQTLMFVTTTIFLTTLLRAEEMTFIFLSMILFVVARVVFWIGYGIDPAYRALGSTASLSNTFVLLATCVYLTYSRGL